MMIIMTAIDVCLYSSSNLPQKTAVCRDKTKITEEERRKNTSNNIIYKNKLTLNNQL